MTTPMFGRLSVDWKDKYLFAEGRTPLSHRPEPVCLLRYEGGVCFFSDRPQNGTFSRRGSASFVPAHPKKSATHFTRNHAWYALRELGDTQR